MQSSLMVAAADAAATISARRALGVATPTDEDDAITSFGEYEALSAQLNYRHGEPRDRRRQGERVDPLQFQLLRRDFAIIGNVDGAARTVLLGGPEAFSSREIVTALFALDVTSWHRLRLLVAAYAGPAGAGS